MEQKTEQISVWSGEFGKNYTDRNPATLEAMNQLYLQNFGVSRAEMNNQFLAFLPKDAKILEVGSNIGMQLLGLQTMGFTRLYGIELQEYAVELSKMKTKKINIIQGSAFDVPFKDGFFDLVFTSGVLIHIAPEHINSALCEIHRVSKKYIWGFEYYSDNYQQIDYRGNENLMWKTNFADLYFSNFADLKIVKRQKFQYLQDDNIDEMFMLEKMG